jgi:hypothetical protein
MLAAILVRAEFVPKPYQGLGVVSGVNSWNPAGCAGLKGENLRAREDYFSEVALAPP